MVGSRKLVPLKPGQVRRTTKPDAPEFGPAMQALPDDVPNPTNPKVTRSWRAFVLNLFLVAPSLGGERAGKGASEAARLAGFGAYYPDGSFKSTPDSMSSIAWKLRHDPRVQLAIQEEVRNHIRGAAPEVLSRLLHVADDTFHKDHVKAIGMLLDRSAPIETMHTVKVEHKDVFDDPGRLAALMRFLIQSGATREGLISKFGNASAPMIDRVLSGQPIDAEFDEVETPEVSDGTEGLEDVL
jgi:hypothetical protein